MEDSMNLNGENYSNKSDSGFELALMIEERSPFSLVTFNGKKSEFAEENTYYFFASRDNTLYDLEVNKNPKMLLIKKKKFNSNSHYECDQTLLINQIN